MTTAEQSHLISTTGWIPRRSKIDLGPSFLHENATLNIPHVSKTRISELLLSIPTYRATGDDGISAKLLRIVAPAIAGPQSERSQKLHQSLRGRAAEPKRLIIDLYQSLPYYLSYWRSIYVSVCTILVKSVAYYIAFSRDFVNFTRAL